MSDTIGANAQRIVGYFDSGISFASDGMGSEDKLMNITIEAVYEAGVFKPLSAVEHLKEPAKSASL